MQITLVAHNIRSTHNVGAFFRTCDGLGIGRIILSGYTPYPKLEDDTRLPHLSDKITRQIHKTALGAESSVHFKRYETLEAVLDLLKTEDAALVALEQADASLNPEECVKKLKAQHPNRPIALIIGNEIHGVAETALHEADLIMEIPMEGSKESFNVSIAAAIALYELSRPIA